MSPQDALLEAAHGGSVQTAVQRQFSEFWRSLGAVRSAAVLMHSDVDGLTAGALFCRTLRAQGLQVEALVTGKGENPWSAPVQEKVARANADVLIVADLGCRPEPVTHRPTLFVDHHRPHGIPPNASLITGYQVEPSPTSGLLAYWCCGALRDVNDLGWMAWLSIFADMGSESWGPELDNLRRRYPVTLLRNAVSLLNAPRRGSTGDAAPALSLLLKARDPTDLMSGSHPELNVLHAAKAEVAAELAKAKKVGPRVRGLFALVLLDSPCQVHPLVAQIWRRRLGKNIVIAANKGFRPGFVHFSVRTALPDTNLLDLLARHAPPDADATYGGGHDQATGGSLSYARWNAFAAGLGFGEEAFV